MSLRYPPIIKNALHFLHGGDYSRSVDHSSGFSYDDVVRERHELRHNHCYSSTVYREKTALINGKLAERYAGHPAPGGWHISNEYGGRCFCTLCLTAFREWLTRRYGTLDSLNKVWWTGFWSHTFTDRPRSGGDRVLQVAQGLRRL